MCKVLRSAICLIFKHDNNIMKSVLRKFSTETEIHQAKIMARGLPKKKPIDGVAHIVMISSGKGGVGKSTTAVNLACALKTGYPSRKVALLDADVFGPSIPLMMNLHHRPLVDDQNRMVPLVNYGVKCMSMGFLIREGSPVIWRGLMVMQALEKLMRHVAWDSIDYMIVDTPPGTGDTHLSLSQHLPISGVILVTTPQSASLQVVRRGAEMYRKLSIPIMGIVENMSYVECNSCHNKINIFGSGTMKLAKDLNCDVLENFALNIDVSDSADKGLPIVISKPDCKESQSYKNLANFVVKFLEKHESIHREN